MTVHRLENANLRIARSITTQFGDQEMFFIVTRLHGSPLAVLQFFRIDTIHLSYKVTKGEW